MLDLVNFSSLSYNFLIYTIPFLFVLTVVVFFHELGHFVIARLNRVDVEAFSVGFGRFLMHLGRFGMALCRFLMDFDTFAMDSGLFSPLIHLFMEFNFFSFLSI